MQTAASKLGLDRECTAAECDHAHVVYVNHGMAAFNSGEPYQAWRMMVVARMWARCARNAESVRYATNAIRSLRNNFPREFIGIPPEGDNEGR